jgi:hypothetical protein
MQRSVSQAEPDPCRVDCRKLGVVVAFVVPQRLACDWRKGPGFARGSALLAGSDLEPQLPLHLYCVLPLGFAHTTRLIPARRRRARYRLAGPREKYDSSPLLHSRHFGGNNVEQQLLPLNAHRLQGSLGREQESLPGVPGGQRYA